MKENKEAEAVELIEEYVETIATVRGIDAEMEEAFPEEWDLRARALVRLPKLEGLMKTAIRNSKQSSIQFGDHSFTTRGVSKTSAALEDIVETAEQRGDIDDLLRCGFLEFKVVPGQLERLPKALRVVYAEFIKKTEGTTQVFIPKALKL